MKRQKANSQQTASIVDSMDVYSLCRWASLKEAIDLIGEKCDERNIDFDSFDVKPLDLLKYVDSMTDDLYNRVTQTPFQT
jgi:phosphate uptake regulator